jgi:putative restriction endonuclease
MPKKMDSFQIRDALLSLGLDLKEKKRALQFSDINGKTIFVKTHYKNPKSIAVDSSPLVLSPESKKIRDKIDAIPDLSVDWETLFHNSNQQGYDKRLNKGKDVITYGYDANLYSENALKTVIELMGFKIKVSPDSSEEQPKPWENADTDISNASSEFSEDETTRAYIIQARLGQGPFRDRLLDYWGSCAVTGAQEKALLRASHIKPWCDSSNRERLDAYNGLLLSANLDAAFDKGLISFADCGSILISNSFKEPESFGINTNQTLSRIENSHLPYLAFHRSNIFLGNL